MAVIGALCWLLVHPERAIEFDPATAEDEFTLAARAGSVVP
jgi:hypothetical protein